MKIVIVGCVVALVLLSSTVRSSTAQDCDPACSEYGGCYNGTCQCNQGFAGNGTYCEDVNECDDYPCDEYATCYNAPGYFICACTEGFSGNGFNCTSLCDPGCGLNEVCTYYEDLYVCFCQDGFFRNATDVCEEPCSGDCGLYETCDYYEGSYQCICQEGFVRNETTLLCQSLCPQPCGDYEECTNEDEGYQCVCKRGYERNYDGYCEDIDECESKCQGYGTRYCNNTVGSYLCTCMDYYFYSFIVDDCISLVDDGPYRLDPLTFEGCFPEVNPYLRTAVELQVKGLLLEYYNAQRDYEEDK